MMIGGFIPDKIDGGNMINLVNPVPDADAFKIEPKPVMHVWEMESCLRCPVAGACLDEGDYRRILKKAGFKIRRMSLHEMHGSVVEHMGDENDISIRVDRLLKKRYAETISRIRELDEEGIAAEWDKGCRNGTMSAVLFSVAVRSGVSVDLMTRIFGEAHMIGHTTGEQVMAIKAGMDRLESEHSNVVEQLKAERKKNKQHVREISTLTKQAASLRREVERKPVERAPISVSRDEASSSESDNRELEARIALLEEENRRLSGELAASRKENRELAADTEELKEVNGTLQNEVGELISRISLLVDGCPEEKTECIGESCGRYKLCAEKILIVGGVTKIKHLYRDLVESKGGVFDYHDGYMTSGKQNLEARIKRSDLVICPVNCNSHGACNKVKELCRKHNKAVSLLASSSLSAISEALVDTSVSLN
jgi:hypothetical protein